MNGKDETTQQMPPALVAKPEAAALLGGVSVRTVDRLRHAGELETQPVGPRLVFITIRSIDAYLARRRGEVGGVEVEEKDPFGIPMLDELRAAAKAKRQAKAAA